MRVCVSAALAILVLVSVGDSFAADTTAAPSASSVTTDSTLAALNASIDWYRNARVTKRAVNRAGAVFGTEDQETARQVLQRAFAVARARAALLKQTPAAAPKPPEQERLSQARAGLEVAIKAEEDWLRRAPPSERAATRRRLELERLRLQIMTQLQSFGASVTAGTPTDLSQQIDALEQSVPELRGSVPTTEPASAVAADTAPRTLGQLNHLIRLRQSRVSVDDLASATASLSRSVTTDLGALRDELRALGGRLSGLAENANAGSADNAESEFQAGLARAKALGAALVPLREQSSLLGRYREDLKGWTRAIDAETADELKSLGLEALRLGVVIGIVLLGAVLWRYLTLRYITDIYRRRLLLTIRSFVVWCAIALVIVFHFASELTALVTALGFAAAGVAFALQNVILALAGYFAMLSPNGIRVGDRVSLQGPYGYVYGEVVEIGLVRIRLNELGGDPPRPTGRIAVFPNSVVFTGTFMKHLPGDEAEPLKRSA